MRFCYGKLIISKSSTFRRFCLRVAKELVQMADAAQDSTIKTDTQTADMISKEEFKRKFIELVAQHEAVINFAIDKKCNC
jgi:hypothetical protein